MSEQDFNRRPLTLLELTQPRCALTFGAGGPDDVWQTPTHTFAQLDTIPTNTFVNTEPLVIDIITTFPVAPAGCIWEYGQGGRGAYLGVTSGELVWRVGNGTIDDGTSMIRVPAAPYEGKTVRLIAEIQWPFTIGTVRLNVHDAATGEILLREKNTAVAPQVLWTFQFDGAVGRNLGVVLPGEDTANWNGVISRCECYANLRLGENSFGCQPWRPASTVRNLIANAVTAKTSEDFGKWNFSGTLPSARVKVAGKGLFQQGWRVVDGQTGVSAAVSNNTGALAAGKYVVSGFVSYDFQNPPSGGQSLLTLQGASVCSVRVTWNTDGTIASVTANEANTEATAFEDLGGGLYRIWARAALVAGNYTSFFWPASFAGGGSTTGGAILYAVQVERSTGGPTPYQRVKRAGEVLELFSPVCYNTRTTCQNALNYDSTDASLTWRFCRPQDEPFWRGLGEVNGKHVKTPAIPCLNSVSTQPSRLNIGAARDGESPFGVRSSLNAQLANIPWLDNYDDPNRSMRLGPPRGTLFAKFKARNEFLSAFEARLYEGYYGQALGDMQTRLFFPEKMQGPDSDGRVTMVSYDPLRLTDEKRSLFPRPTDIRLKDAITDTASLPSMRVFGSLADLTDAFGNTVERYARLEGEIFTYTAATLIDEETGEYELTGITRGVLGTTRDAHEVGEGVQRVGRYFQIPFWQVQYDLLANHTPAKLDPDRFIDIDQWNEEGGRYLGIFRATGTVPEPTPVAQLSGELNQQGLFNVWWDERTQTIPMLAVRPPSGTPAAIDERANILPGAELRHEPDERLTRVLVYYNQRNPLESRTDPKNYPDAAFRGEGDPEQPEQGGEVRTKIIYSRWIREDALAIQFSRRLLSRFLKTPRYFTFRLDAKDRSITIGSVLSITSNSIEDTDGRSQPVLWQVISENEIVPGETVVYDAQTYSFVGRFANYMAPGSPEYLASTDEQKNTGAFYAGANGLMSNNDPGFQYQ
jgi:hypothetical protein